MKKTYFKIGMPVWFVNSEEGFVIPCTVIDITKESKFPIVVEENISEVIHTFTWEGSYEESNEKISLFQNQPFFDVVENKPLEDLYGNVEKIVYKFQAMDKNGLVWKYANEPTISITEEGWVNNSPLVSYVGKVPNPERFDWTKSLVKL